MAARLLDTADAINADKDVHPFSAPTTGITYDEFFRRKKELKDVRQGAKIGNFGYPGMMGEAEVRRRPEEAGVRRCELFFNDGRCGNGEDGTRRVMFWKEKPLDAPLCERCLTQSAHIRRAS